MVTCLNLHFLLTGVKTRRLGQVIVNVLSSSKISLQDLNSYSVKFQLAFIPKLESSTSGFMLVTVFVYFYFNEEGKSLL